MQKTEILHTRIGEMFEMIDCSAIAHGADPVGQAITDYDDAINMR